MSKEGSAISGATEQAPLQSPRYLRTNQVAELLRVDPTTVTRWARAGKLPYWQTFGGHRRYPQGEVRRLAAALRSAPPARGAAS